MEDTEDWEGEGGALFPAQHLAVAASFPPGVFPIQNYLSRGPLITCPPLLSYNRKLGGSFSLVFIYCIYRLLCLISHISPSIKACSFSTTWVCLGATSRTKVVRKLL